MPADAEAAMKRRWMATAVLMMASAAARGQAAEAFDRGKYLQELQDSGTRLAAAGRMAGLPEAAIVPLAEAAADEGTAAGVRAVIRVHLPELYGKWREARAKRDEAADEAWTKAHLLAVYRAGAGGGKAQAEAEAALRLITAGKRDYGVFKAAVDAQAAAGVKPDDPAIHVGYVVSGLVTHEMALDHAVKQLDPALAALDASAYSDGVKFVLHRWLLACMTTPDWPADFAVKATVKGETARVLELLPAFVGEHPGQTRLASETINGYYAMWRAMKAQAAFEQISPVLDQALKGNAARDAVAAAAYEEWAWEARGGGFANTVTAEGWQLFAERIKKSHEAAEAGWREDPFNTVCCDLMIRVCMGGELGDDAMESWFERAMLADPNDAEACQNKAFYLSPQWHGNAEDAIVFGRECVEKGKPRNRVSLVIVSVYSNLARLTGRAEELYTDPEVWKDIRAAYGVVVADESRLKDDRKALLKDRSELMMWALRCGQWQAYLDLSKKFGEEVDAVTLGGKDRRAFYERLAAERLAGGK
jgi:hypothetical protein